MSKYSRYGSYFLANEKDDEDPNAINAVAKSINRKRFDFVNDTDPENIADNLNDEDIPDEEIAPEGFPMGDISDEPDDPSDNIEQFPTDDDTDELEDFPTDDGDIEDFPSEDKGNDELEDFPTEDNGESKLDDFPTDDSSNTEDATSLMDDIIKNKFGDKLPTPDEIIDDLRQKVYGDNPPEATQNNDNNMPEFPDANNQEQNQQPVENPNNTAPTDQPFPTDDQNPMGNTPDNTGMSDFPTDVNNPAGDVNAQPTGMENFPTDVNNPAGGDQAVNATVDPNAGIGDFPGGDTDFTAGADAGGAIGGSMPGAPGAPGAPMQQPGPGVGYDSMRKYNLYKEYHKLLEAIGNYINKLENIMFDEPHQNLIVKTVIDKLNEIKKLCSDYINMKFEVAGYAQAYVFFEELIVSIQIVFTILMTISSYNTDKDDKKPKSSGKNEKPKASNKKK